MNSGNEEKTSQLRMPLGTASGRMKKSLMFMLAEKLNLTSCFRCQKKIEMVDDFSIDHKIDWLHSPDPVGLFFDLGASPSERGQ